MPLILGAIAVMSVLPILAWTFLGSGGEGGGALKLPKVKRVKGQKSPKRKGKVGAAELMGGGRGGTDYRSQVLARSATDRAIAPALRAVVRKVSRLTPKGWVNETEQRLAMAGLTGSWTAEKVLTLKTIGGILGSLLSFWFFSRGIGSKLNLIGFLACAPFGFFICDILIKNGAQKRQQLIQRELPDILDQITVGVEAGLGFDSAMARSAKSNDGPLAEEFARTLQHVAAGLSRAEALRGMANRNKVPELRQFIGAILQAEQFGIPMAQVLRVQAGEQRRRRRQRAEEKAMKLPVKVLFPLVLCILPALFIVLIGPAALQIRSANFG
jgi:tight adherence protein C